MDMEYQVAVLGGGPGGYEAAIRCAQYGLKTVLIEARELGGTCLNRGCIPTKSLLHSAELYRQAKGGGPFGVEAREVRFDYAKMAARKDEVVAGLRRGIGALERAHGVEVVAGFGVLRDAHTIQVGDRTLTAHSIILATGSAPARPPIPGIDSPRVLTSDEALALTACPDSLVIVGGGVIGMEFATLFSSLGRPVTVLELMPAILPGVDDDLVRLLTRSLKAQGVGVVTRAQVSEIRENGDDIAVRYRVEGQNREATASHCLLSVGRVPQTGGIGLEEAGVYLDRGFVRVDAGMRTNVPSLYAIGDITGKLQLAHVATAQGLVAASNCAGKPAAMDYGIIPSCIYTSPEIATIGVQAEQAGRPTVTGSFSLAGNGRSLVMGENTGMAKLISDPATGEILGAQIMAPRATDMIAEIAAIMRCEGTVEELSDTIHPHPTVSEIILEAAHDTHGMSCNAPPKK